jgi:hypothetical protein
VRTLVSERRVFPGRRSRLFFRKLSYEDAPKRVSKSLTGGQAFACPCVAPAGQSRNLSSALHLGLPISCVPEIVRAFAWAELSRGVGEGVRGGVNIAARVEGLCEPGGVLISGAAYDHVRGKIDAQFVDLGDKDLKNVVRPVRVYVAVG